MKFIRHLLSLILILLANTLLGKYRIESIDIDNNKAIITVKEGLKVYKLSGEIIDTTNNGVGIEQNNVCSVVESVVESVHSSLNHIAICQSGEVFYTNSKEENSTDSPGWESENKHNYIGQRLIKPSSDFYIPEAVKRISYFKID